jgi:D-glycero-alpha-D-manno-heptose-7-phosphate kinase
MKEQDVIRARAPLRIGLAGGGTDVSPYCDKYGGAVLNITINMYAYATIVASPDGKVHFVGNDVGTEEVHEPGAPLPTDQGLRLHRGVYNRIIRDYNDGKPLPITLVTSVDSPFGSGLGSSSALTVAMVEAFRAYLKLPLGEYDVAHLAFVVERLDIGLNGGRQDQYAATFGGINFMEFAANDRVIVNPLRIPESTLSELESSTLLYFTGVSRASAAIIDHQTASIRAGTLSSVEAMHQLKREALELKAALLRGGLHEMVEILRRGWEAKKATAPGVTTELIDSIYTDALAAGALAGKVSGAGGGGFMMFLVDPIERDRVAAALRKRDGHVHPCAFTEKGASSWTVRRSTSVSGDRK